MTQVRNRHRLWIPLIAMLAVLGALAAWLLLPSGYVAIDLNPSIEIQTNRLNHVVSVKGANADARKLLKDYVLPSRDLETVVEDLVDRMAQQGYLKDAKDQNDILITVDSSAASDRALERVNKAISSYLEERRIGAQLLEQKLTVDNNLKALAKQYGISAGRLAVIEKLFDIKDAKTVKDLANMRVSDLLDYARKEGISTNELEQAFDDLDDLYRYDIFDRLEEQFDNLTDRKDEEKKPEWDDLWTKLWDDSLWTEDPQTWEKTLETFLSDRDSDWDEVEDYLEKYYGGKWDAIEDSLEARYGDDWDDRYDNDRHDDWDDRYDDDRYDDDRYDDDWDDRYDDDHDDDWDDRYDDDHDDDDDWDDDDD